MADDGMLLNFSTTEAAPKYQPKFKGGSWKERLVAKKIARHRQLRNAQIKLTNGKENVNERDNATVPAQNGSEFPPPRPVKRRREGGDFTPASSQGAVPKSNRALQDQSRSSDLSQSREVISSLFSYNPKPAIVPEQPSDPINDIPAQPSNAPLVDGADTFASLGLSNIVANHLITKLELKKPTAIQKSSISQLAGEDSDAFIQSETGSGKTLAYLLPLLQRMMSLSAPNSALGKDSDIDGAVHRDSGLFAIVIAPTRELCKQISVVLERLLGCAHWLVAGTVIGGEKKKSEKARLRKGLNILLATPGRLADHLENTKVLDVSNVRWLVLDEGDRLMDLGFEDEIQKIVKKLDEGYKESSIVGLPRKRTTVLCSATMKMNVQRLGEISLKDAALIKPDVNTEETNSDPALRPDLTFYAPAQLKQSYTIVAAKLRLVTLAALLKRTFARKGSVMKAIVFLSCADSVDFHYDVLTRPVTEEADDKPASTTSATPTSSIPSVPYAPSPHLSSSAISTSTPLMTYKLHGSLPQQTRTSILRHFSTSTTPSLLLATDVASRGLDLPNLDLVIEYDPPFSSDDHLHRIGRTARLGRDGRAVIFLLPGSEEGYVEVLRNAYHPSAASEGVNGNVTHMSCNDILKRGFSPASGVIASKRSLDPTTSFNWEGQATSFQLQVERWVLSSPRSAEMAKKAFQSHVRAYATHVSAERKWFDIKDLHLGHLAKSFGLRDAPGRINMMGMRGKQGEKRRSGAGEGRKSREAFKDGEEVGKEVDEAAQKMKRKMREMGKLGSAGGAGEFNIA
jgi:ATP-dependent RNA helicase DDX31/DBP7